MAAAGPGRLAGLNAHCKKSLPELFKYKSLLLLCYLLLLLFCYQVVSIEVTFVTSV